MSASERQTDELDREEYKVRYSVLHCYVQINTYVLRLCTSIYTKVALSSSHILPDAPRQAEYTLWKQTIVAALDCGPHMHILASKEVGWGDNTSCQMHSTITR